MRSRWVLALAVLALFIAPMAHAATGEWSEVGRTPIPLHYYQGMTHDEAGNRYFTGVWFGLYRTDPALNETGRNDDVIPPDVHAREGYNHVGDLSYSGGKLYLPLECYYPPAGNTCGTGAIGIADPQTLVMDYYVKLDPREISKAMWCEVSPDGTTLWTQSGNDLLAYDITDLTSANAAPEAGPISATQRLRGAVPAEGITGATFIGDKLFVAGQDSTGGIIYSIDLTTGSRTLETRVSYIGESEGLDDDFDLDATADALPGSLHYMVMPYNEEAYPTNGVTNGVIYHFESSDASGAETTSVSFTEQSASSGQYTDRVMLEARLVDSGGNPIDGETLTFALEGSPGQMSGTTDADGIAAVSLELEQPPGDYEVTVSYSGSDGNYSASSASAPFVVHREDSETTIAIGPHGRHRVVEATLSDADSQGSGIAGRTMRFYADGELIGSSVTDSSGHAQVELPPRYRGGHHTYEARFDGDDYFLGSSGTTST